MASSNLPKTVDIHTSDSLSAEDAKSTWQLSIVNEWNVRRSKELKDASILFPLAMNPFGEEEILAMTEVLLTGRLTLGAEVEKAEKKFAQIVGMPYAVMVNSGSSANLLAVSAIANKLRSVHCDPGDHVLVPAVCWSTSVFPLIQNGLRPIFVDVDPRTFNVSLDELEKKMTNRVKAVMAVHVLGNSINMQQMIDFVNRHNLILIEDTCESLGTYYETNKGNNRQMLGTFGDFGTFSFYFSHHITSGEGGMVTCKTETDYNFVRCLRAHGWTRHLTNRQQVENLYEDIDSRFLFVNMGYNLRPLEVQGAMLSVQLDKLDQFNAFRRDNLKRIKEALSRDSRFSYLMSLMEASENIDPAWFGLGVLLHRPYAHQRSDFLKYLEKNGIENRPIISGNFVRQPCISAFCDEEHPEDYPGAEAIHTRGFFIGIHQIPLDESVIEKLVNILLSYSFSPYHIVLVTGSEGMLGKYVRDVVSEQWTNENSTLKETLPMSLKIKLNDSEWIFVTRSDGDLTKVEDVKHIFKRFQPTRILHCAAHSTLTEEMSSKPVDLWLNNVRMNSNILEAASDFQTWIGPIKVVSILSTIPFSKKNQLCLDDSIADEELLQPVLESYSSANRSLAHLTQWYREQYGCNFVTILSDNIYGAYDDFNPCIASPINAFIRKIESENDYSLSTSPLPSDVSNSFWKVTFAYDLARIGIWTLDNYDEKDPLVIAGDKVSISQIAKLAREQTNLSDNIQLDHNSHNNERASDNMDKTNFATINPEFKMTPLSVGIKRTMEWYRKNGCDH